MSSGDAYDAASAHIKGAESYLQPKIGHVFTTAAAAFQSTMATATAKFSEDVRLVRIDDGAVNLQLGESGFVHRALLQLPGYLVTIGDYVLTNGPLTDVGLIISAGLRMLLGNMFEKQKFMPADLLRRWMVGNAKQEIAAALTTLQNQANGLVASNVQQVEAHIKSDFSELIRRLNCSPWSRR